MTAPPDATRRDVVIVTVIAAVCATVLCVFAFGIVAQDPPLSRPVGEAPNISSMYDPPADAIENTLVKGDGQLFAGQATDPLVRRPEMVRGGPAEQAYRYQRPLYGWLGWAASGGQPGAVAVALIAVTVAAVALLVGLVARWLAARGADPRWALAVLAMPGVFVDLTWIGPEALGTALVVAGSWRWMRVRATPRAVAPTLVPDVVDWGAVALFATAGLARETLLLVPLVLVAAAVWRRRWVVAFGAALAAVPYVVWVLVLRVRIGAWPEGSVGGRASAVPFAGLVDAADGWRAGDVAFALVLLALAVGALVVGRASGLRPLVAAQLALAALLGAPVWIRFADFGRVLLPLGVFSLLAVVTGLVAPSPTAEGDPSDLVPEGVADPAT